MRKTGLLCGFMLALALAVPAGASLVTIGTADYMFGTYNLIYDDDSPFGSIVWLDYTFGPLYQANHVLTADYLNNPGVLTYNIDPAYTVTWGGDWRLPATVDGLMVWGYDGTTTAGYNITSSEMGHLYYTELGNLGSFDTNGHWISNHGLCNISPFSNLIAASYWSGTEYSLGSSDHPGAWYFDTALGSQYETTENFMRALAVRPGQVAPVPLPAGVLLLGSGLAGLVGLACRRRQRFIAP